MYNYMEAMKEDIKSYLEDNEWKYDADNFDCDELYDDMFVADEITGNASGSYTFDREEAKEYVIDNMDLCVEALKEFDVSNEEIATKFLAENWEYFDVTIRCYLLQYALEEVLTDMGIEY